MPSTRGVICLASEILARVTCNYQCIVHTITTDRAPRNTSRLYKTNWRRAGTRQTGRGQSEDRVMKYFTISKWTTEMDLRRKRIVKQSAVQDFENKAAIVASNYDRQSLIMYRQSITTDGCFWRTIKKNLSPPLLLLLFFFCVLMFSIVACLKFQVSLSFSSDGSTGSSAWMI